MRTCGHAQHDWHSRCTSPVQQGETPEDHPSDTPGKRQDAKPTPKKHKKQKNKKQKNQNNDLEGPPGTSRKEQEARGPAMRGLFFSGSDTGRPVTGPTTESQRRDFGFPHGSTSKTPPLRRTSMYGTIFGLGHRTSCHGSEHVKPKT